MSVIASITMTSKWARLRLKSSASRVFTKPFIREQIKEIIKAPRHWPLCEEFTGYRWIPRTNGPWCGKCFHLMTSSCKIGNPTACSVACPAYHQIKHSKLSITGSLWGESTRLWPLKYPNKGPVMREAFHTWRRYQMKTFFALLALSMGKSSVTGEFPSQRPVTQQTVEYTFETLVIWDSAHSLWRHCNNNIGSLFFSPVITMVLHLMNVPLNPYERISPRDHGFHDLACRPNIPSVWSDACTQWWPPNCLRSLATKPNVTR